MSETVIGMAGLRWHLGDDLAGAVQQLFAPAGLRLDEWLASGQAVRIKHAPHRSIYRVRLGELDFHLKHYRDDGKERLRGLFRPGRAQGEAELTREVARREVPTLEVLGWTEAIGLLGSCDSYLFTRTLPDVVCLLDFLDTTLPSLPCWLRWRWQQRLADALGTFLARIHLAGISHGDLHPGNILLGPDALAPQLYLIDLNAARLGAPLSWQATQANLAILNRWFALRASRADRRRCWRAYCKARVDLQLDERLTAREVEAATLDSLVGFARQLDDRSLGGNRHYRKVRAAGAVGHAVMDFDPALLRSQMASPDVPFDTPGVRTLKRSASSVVVELVLPLEDNPRPVIAKRINAGARDPLVSLFRPPAALHSYIMGHGLRLRGLPTPRPLAVWHRRRWGLLAEGYLLVEKVPAAVELGAFLDLLWERPAPERRERLWRLIDELAGLLRLMHGWRLSHRDLKAANVLVSPQAWSIGPRGVRECESGHCPGAALDHVWFVDLAGVRRCWWLARKRRVLDLARLAVSFLEHPGLSRSDRLRFLRTYLHWGLAGKAGWKEWWKEIGEAALAKAARNRRVGRVVG